MIRVAKVRAVARFEFRNVVQRWSWVLSTFGLPLFFVTLSGTMVSIQGSFLSERISGTAVFGIVDHAGLLPRSAGLFHSEADLSPASRQTLDTLGLRDGLYLDLDSLLLRRYDSEHEAARAVARGEIGAAYVLPRDYLERGHVRALIRHGGPVLSVRASTVEPVLRQLLVQRLLSGRVPPEIIDRVREPMTIDRIAVTQDAAIHASKNRMVEQLVRAALPFLLGVLLLTALLSSSAYLVQTIVNDKENKVVEVLLSCADPDELLTGKLLGLGAAGLLQFAVWSAMVVSGALMAASVLSHFSISVPWEALGYAPIFFVLGYLFIGSLMLATGSLGTSAPEAQKMTIGWAMLSVLPLMLIVVLLEEPNGAWGQLLSLIPFSAPLTMIVRLSVDPAGVAGWEIALSMSILLASTWLAIRLGARLFRVGLLLGGSRPSLREILRQARLMR
ncbi:MAG: ABC transporter permease [Deltaproteobacteria bacterium]|nr:ABC transporter permease [Deltaproteobacteria bacterium]